MLTLGMLHSAVSLPYTRVAIASLRRWTTLPYRLVVVDSTGRDRDELLAAGVDEYLTPPEVPGYFARNANLLIARTEGDVVLLQNDVLFTPGWLEPLVRAARERPGMITPVSNFHLQFSSGELTFRPTMRLEDVAGREEQVFEVAREVARRYRGQTRELPKTMPFVCYIPAEIGRQLPFDEGFVNGCEDDDLSIRAHLAGVPVCQVMDSFILHFGGKSLYDGGETPAESQRRRDQVVARLMIKWGPQVAAVMTSDLRDEVLREHGLEGLWARGEFAEAIRRLVAAHVEEGSALR